MNKEFAESNLKKINREDIKVGDIVGVRKEVQLGWRSNFRYPRIVALEVKRITPARTKIELSNGMVVERYEQVYAIDDVAKYQTNIATHAENIKNIVLDLSRHNLRELLSGLSDEQVVEMSHLLSEAMEVARNEK